VRLLRMLRCGAESIEQDEAMFQPAANAVLRQWNALSPARQEIVRHYAWIFVSRRQHHSQYPAAPGGSGWPFVYG